MPSALVFAPLPCLTVTIERRGDGDDIHVHAGGQGFWVARMLATLEIPVTICGAFGGETGTVIRTLIEQQGIAVSAVDVETPNLAYVHDRRSGERRVVSETPVLPLSRHDVDELYGGALVGGLAASITIVTGSPRGVLPDETFRRLTRDLRANGGTVVADLSGGQLRAALDGGVDVLKVSHAELIEDGWADGASETALFRAMSDLCAAGARTVVVSRAEHPALVLDDHLLASVDVPTFEPLDHRGAGDSMTAGIGAALADGASPPSRDPARCRGRDAQRDAARTRQRRAIRHRAARRTGRATTGRRARRSTTSAHHDSRGARREGESAMRTRALVVNDDGVNAPGIRATRRGGVQRRSRRGRRRAAAGGERFERGAHRVPGRRSHRRRAADVRRARRRTGVRRRAAPAFIALIASRGAFGPPPSILLSGINRGLNTGHAVLHSGTVGAAMTGRVNGCRALAVSLDVGDQMHWDTARAVAQEAVGWVLAMSSPMVLNVNVPNIPFLALRGVRQGALARFGAVQTTIAEIGEGFVRLGVADDDAHDEPGSDAALVAADFASVTALRPLCDLHDDGLTCALDRQIDLSAASVLSP